MEIERELKEKLLILFEETDRQSEEQEAYIQELRQRLKHAEKDLSRGQWLLEKQRQSAWRIYLDRLNCAIEVWDESRESKGAQYVVTEDETKC